MPNRESFDMLMLDLYQMIKSGNGKIRRFVVSEQTTEAIAAREPLSNGELKLQVVNVGFEATAEQTESILRDIKHLQPLLAVKDYQSTQVPKQAAEERDQGVCGPSIINTSFQLQAIMSASSEEAALATGSGNQKK